MNDNQRDVLNEISNFINWYTSDENDRNRMWEAAKEYVLQDEVLSVENSVSIIWTVDDVMYEREDLSESQAREVLKAVKRNHDAEIGVNWDVIRTHADEMFPVEGV